MGRTVKKKKQTKLSNKEFWIFLSSLILISLILIIFIITNVSALAACSDLNEIDIADIPCQGITKVIACSGNVSQLALNTSTQSNLTTFSIGGSQYNFTFNVTEGSYELKDCFNNTATVLVGDFPRDDMWMIALILGLIGCVIIFFVLARFVIQSRNWMMKQAMYLVSFFFMILTVQMGLTLSRVAKVGTMMTVGLITIMTVAAIFFAYIFIYYMIEVINSFKLKKAKQKGEIDEDEEDE